MDEISHYEALLSGYANQQVSLTERSTELKELSAEYQATMQTLNKLRKERDTKNLQLNQNKVQIMGRLDSILNTCKDNGMYWKAVETKQSDIHTNQEKVKSINQKKVDVARDLVKNHNQLDTEICSENMLSKIQDYRHNCDIVQDFILQAKKELQDVSKCATIASEYNIPDLMMSNRSIVGSRKKLSALNAEIEDTKKQLQTIMSQMNETNGSS